MKDADKKITKINNFTGFRCKFCGTHLCTQCIVKILQIDDETGWKEASCPKCKANFGPVLALMGEHTNPRRLAWLKNIRMNYLKDRTKLGGWELSLTLCTLMIAWFSLAMGVKDPAGLSSPENLLAMILGLAGTAFAFFRLFSSHAVLELIDAGYILLLGIVIAVIVSYDYPAVSEVPIYYTYVCCVVLWVIAGLKAHIFYKDKERTRIARELLQE